LFFSFSTTDQNTIWWWSRFNLFWDIIFNMNWLPTGLNSWHNYRSWKFILFFYFYLFIFIFLLIFVLALLWNFFLRYFLFHFLFIIIVFQQLLIIILSTKEIVVSSLLVYFPLTCWSFNLFILGFIVIQWLHYFS